MGMATAYTMLVGTREMYSPTAALDSRIVQLEYRKMIN